MRVSTAWAGRMYVCGWTRASGCWSRLKIIYNEKKNWSCGENGFSTRPLHHNGYCNVYPYFDWSAIWKRMHVRLRISVAVFFYIRACKAYVHIFLDSVRLHAPYKRVILHVRGHRRAHLWSYVSRRVHAEDRVIFYLFFILPPSFVPPSLPPHGERHPTKEEGRLVRRVVCQPCWNVPNWISLAAG